MLKPLLLLGAVWLAATSAVADPQPQDTATPGHVRVLATGGTIAGSGQGSSASYISGVVPIGDILQTVPGLSEIANISAEQIANIGSSDMDEAVWLRLLDRVQTALLDPKISGVVITHGTDTLEETAYFLSLVLPSTKPVVLVGSMRPGTAVSADGPQILLDAVRVASSDQARDWGTLVVMNDTIFDPASLTKVDIERVNAFSDPGRGPLGEVLTDHPRFFARATPYAAAFPNVHAGLPRVAIVYSYAGIRGEDIHAAANGADALVVAGAGSGGFSTHARQAVRELTARGIPVVRTARQGFGDVQSSDSDQGDWSDQAVGTVAGRELTPAKARVLLMLALSTPRSRDELQALFDQYGTGGR